MRFGLAVLCVAFCFVLPPIRSANAQSVRGAILQDKQFVNDVQGKKDFKPGDALRISTSALVVTPATQSVYYLLEITWIGETSGTLSKASIGKSVPAGEWRLIGVLGTGHSPAGGAAGEIITARMQLSYLNLSTLEFQTLDTKDKTFSP